MLPTLRAINNEGSHFAANKVLVTFFRFISDSQMPPRNVEIANVHINNAQEGVSRWHLAVFETVPEVNVRSSSLSTKETSFE